MEGSLYIRSSQLTLLKKLSNLLTDYITLFTILQESDSSLRKIDLN